MEKITKVVVTCTDGSEHTYEGDGGVDIINTYVVAEYYDGETLKTKRVPVRYVNLILQPPDAQFFDA